MKKAFLLMFLLFLILGCSNSQAENNESFSDMPTIETPTIKKSSSINYPESILQSEEQIDISIGVYHSVSGGLLFLADGLEYFEKSGLNVTMKLYGDYKTLIDGFRKGEVDVATIGLYESMMLALEDIDFIGVAPLIWKQTYFMVSKDNYKKSLAKDIKEEIEKVKGGKIKEIDTNSEEAIKVIYSIAGKEIKQEININESIKNIKNLKGKVIGLDTRSIAYYILNNELINGAGLMIDEVEAVFIPETQLKSEIFKGKTNVGEFSEFNKLDDDAGGIVVFDSTDYKTHTVESLLFQRGFSVAHRDAVIKVIDGWKKAIVFLRNDPQSAIEIMTDRGRLNFKRDKLEKVLESTPIIPIMNTKNDNNVENELRESYFNRAGNYSIEASQLLDFITKNYDEYNKTEYQLKTHKIKEKLEEGYYYNISFLEIAGFNEPDYTPINFEKLDKSKWLENLQDIYADYGNINWDKIYPKMVYAPQAIKINVFENEIIPRLPNMKNKYTETIINQYIITYQRYIGGNTLDEVDLKLIDMFINAGYDEIKSITSQILENNIMPILLQDRMDIISKRYTKKVNHYIKNDITIEEDDEIVEILNDIGFEDISELESKDYDPVKEGVVILNEILASGEEGEWGFIYENKSEHLNISNFK